MDLNAIHLASLKLNAKSDVGSFQLVTSRRAEGAVQTNKRRAYGENPRIAQAGFQEHCSINPYPDRFAVHNHSRPRQFE